MGLFTTNPVLDLLKQDHTNVKELFEQFEEAKDFRSRERIIQQTLFELDIHAKLEETLIYPAIREKIDEDKVMDEALEEHHVAHFLINELKRMRPTDDRYEAKFIVLGESIKHHVKEEESTMFPEAEKADIDWEELSKKVTKRKEDLLANKNNGARRPRKQSRGQRRRGSRAGQLKKAA